LLGPDASRRLQGYGSVQYPRRERQALITKADIALTKDAISAAGDSKGLHYNIFCGGNVALADGRWAFIGGHDTFIGGHDKSGNNGIRKITIFDR